MLTNLGQSTPRHILTNLGQSTLRYMLEEDINGSFVVVAVKFGNACIYYLLLNTFESHKGWYIHHLVDVVGFS